MPPKINQMNNYRNRDGKHRPKESWIYKTHLLKIFTKIRKSNENEQSYDLSFDFKKVEHGFLRH